MEAHDETTAQVTRGVPYAYSVIPAGPASSTVDFPINPTRNHTPSTTVQHHPPTGREHQGRRPLPPRTSDPNETDRFEDSSEDDSNSIYLGSGRNPPGSSARRTPANAAQAVRTSPNPSAGNQPAGDPFATATTARTSPSYSESGNSSPGAVVEPPRATVTTSVEPSRTTVAGSPEYDPDSEEEATAAQASRNRNRVSFSDNLVSAQRPAAAPHRRNPARSPPRDRNLREFNDRRNQRNDLPPQQHRQSQPQRRSATSRSNDSRTSRPYPSRDSGSSSMRPPAPPHQSRDTHRHAQQGYAPPHRHTLPPASQQTYGQPAPPHHMLPPAPQQAHTHPARTLSEPATARADRWESIQSPSAAALLPAAPAHATTCVAAGTRTPRTRATAARTAPARTATSGARGSETHAALRLSETHATAAPTPSLTTATPTPPLAAHAMEAQRGREPAAHAHNAAPTHPTRMAPKRTHGPCLRLAPSPHRPTSGISTSRPPTPTPPAAAPARAAAPDCSASKHTTKETRPF